MNHSKKYNIWKIGIQKKDKILNRRLDIIKELSQENFSELKAGVFRLNGSTIMHENTPTSKHIITKF